MRAVALLVSLSLSLAACFPHNSKHRTYAKLGEGAALATGIVMLYFVNTGADCDMNPTPGVPADDCKGEATILSSVGLGLILVGLAGFIATVSTSPDDDADTKVTVPAATTPEATPAAAPAAPAPQPAAAPAAPTTPTEPTEPAPASPPAS